MSMCSDSVVAESSRSYGSIWFMLSINITKKRTKMVVSKSLLVLPALNSPVFLSSASSFEHFNVQCMNLFSSKIEGHQFCP